MPDYTVHSDLRAAAGTAEESPSCMYKVRPDGDHVKKGQLLVSFDMEKVKAAGYDVTTPLIVTNSDDYKDVKILSEDSVTPSDKVLEIVK